MSKKGRKRADGPVYRPQLPAGWTWPVDSWLDSPIRRNLPADEEAEIANTPRPVKSAADVQAEAAVRAARADPTAPPDLLPPTIVVNRGGVPEYHPAMLRLLTGERAESEEDRRWRLLLADLAHTSPPAYALLAARWLDGRADRDLGRQLGCDHKTVGRMIDRIERRLLAQYQALYGHAPLDR